MLWCNVNKNSLDNVMLLFTLTTRWLYYMHTTTTKEIYRKKATHSKFLVDDTDIKILILSVVWCVKKIYKY